MILLKNAKVLLISFVCFACASALAVAEDRFAIAVGVHDTLVIFGPKGDRVAELAVPTIAQATTVGDVSFQVSYGRDAGGKLTAILAPNESSPSALHFNVLGKAVDAEKAVVTLVFASNLKSVTVDPGYGGTVEVNSHRLRKHSLSDDAPVPRLPMPVQAVASAPVATESTAPESKPAPSSSPAITEVAATAAPADQPPQPMAPATIASQLSTSVLDGSTTPTAPAVPAVASDTTAESTITSDAAVTSVTTERVKLYWSEPITAPDGTAPACGNDEIKLVEVQGSVTVTLPNGETKDGFEGMTVPSGSSVTTNENASTALFFGGVNSARLLPRCDLTVTQTLDGTTRKNAVDLRSGAVFSRIGKRDGEVQDYQVRTPEGVSASDTPNMLAFRGTADDIPALRTALDSGLILDPSRLLAWNPVSFGRNLVSDVVNPILGAPRSTTTTTSTIFYYAPGKSLNLSQVQSQVIASNTTNGATGSSNPNGPNVGGLPGGGGGGGNGANNPNTILQGLLVTLAPYNTKLNSLLGSVNSGRASKAELAFYHSLITVFFDRQVPSISSQIRNLRGNTTAAGIAAAHLALLRDLRPFVVPRASPN